MEEDASIVDASTTMEGKGRTGWPFKHGHVVLVPCKT